MILCSLLAVVDELLFSPFELTEHDEKSLEKFEQLNRMNPFLFSPRHAPASYPLELVYMLLHEYNGNLQRTLASLLEGTARDIKQCRPLHHYRFPECDSWTKEEMDAFTKAIPISEKNFVFISAAVWVYCFPRFYDYSCSLCAFRSKRRP
jgi:hypothetical protein